MTDGQAYVDIDDLVAIRGKLKVWRDTPIVNLFDHFAGQQPSPQRGRGMDFEELRHYQQGDDVRRIDWRVSQRSGSPHVRVYSEESDRATLVLLDQRMSMFFGSQRDTKSAAAAKVAALIAWRDVQVGDRFGLCVFNDQTRQWFKPARYKDHVMRCMHAMVDFNGQLFANAPDIPAKQSLKAQLIFALNTGVADQRIVIISDLAGWCEECPGLISLLRRHHDVLVLYIFDPLERDLSPASGSMFGNHHYQLHLNADLIERADIAKVMADRLAILDSLGIPCVMLSAGDNIIGDALQHLARLRYGH